MTVQINKLCACRACDSANLEMVLDFEKSGLADDYFKEKDNSQTYPLGCLLCLECGLLQLEYVVDASAIYDDYIYVSASSPGLNEHFKSYANAVVKVLTLNEHSRVLDVGCNDGMLLKHFQQHGCSVFGVEPSTPIAEKLNEEGIHTLNGYWNKSSSVALSQKQDKFDLITSNNVFANVNDIQEFALSTISVLKQSGVWVIETGYHLSLIENFVFDNIYHEHLSYFSVSALQRFFKRFNMEIFHVEKVESKGGSIRIYACFSGSSHTMHKDVGIFIEQEQRLGLFTLETYAKYMERLHQLKQDVHAYLSSLVAKQVTLIGFGASATVTTVLHVLDIGRYFSFLIDDNPIKQNTFSPGYRIPVKSVKDLDKKENICVVILPWRFAQMFIEKNNDVLEHGGSFLKIIPRVEHVVHKT